MNGDADSGNVQKDRGCCSSKAPLALGLAEAPEVVEHRQGRLGRLGRQGQDEDLRRRVPQARKTTRPRRHA